MKKVLALSAVAILMLALLTSCFGGTAIGDTNDELVGTWYFFGSPYYVLNEDGSGTVGGSAITWWVDGNTFFYCATPNLCGNNRCTLPIEQPWSIDGDVLTLTLLGTEFTYTRTAD